MERHTESGKKLNLVAALEQAKLVLYNELNYLQEARNTEALRENLADFPQIYIPAVIHDFSSSRVLTTELVKGKKVSKLTPLALVEGNFDPQRVIRDCAERLIGQKLAQKFNPGNFYPALLDLNQLVLDLPHRAREIVDLTAAGKLTFGIKLTQAEEFLGGIHKIANRIIAGVVIAALLVSSSMMMRVPSTFPSSAPPVSPSSATCSPAPPRSTASFRRCSATARIRKRRR